MRSCNRCGEALPEAPGARHVCSGKRSHSDGLGAARPLRPKVVPFRAKKPLPKSRRPRGSDQSGEYVKWVWAALLIGSLVWPYLTSNR